MLVIRMITDIYIIIFCMIFNILKKKNLVIMQYIILIFKIKKFKIKKILINNIKKK